LRNDAAEAARTRLLLRIVPRGKGPKLDLDQICAGLRYNVASLTIGEMAMLLTPKRRYRLKVSLSQYGLVAGSQRLPAQVRIFIGLYYGRRQRRSTIMSEAANAKKAATTNVRKQISKVDILSSSHPSEAKYVVIAPSFFDIDQVGVPAPAFCG
jgi:hypothetical protein